MKHLTKIAATLCLLGAWQFGLAMDEAATHSVFNKLQKVPFGTLNNLTLLKDLCDDDSLCQCFGSQTIDRTVALTLDQMRNVFTHLMTRDYSSAQEWKLLLNHREDWGQAATSSDQHGVIHRSYKNGIKEHILVDSDHNHYKAILEFYREGLEPITMSGLVSELAIEGLTARQLSSSSSSSSVATTAPVTAASSSSASATTVPATTSASASATSSSTLSQETSELFNRAMPAVIAMTMAAFTHGSQAAKKQ